MTATLLVLIGVQLALEIVLTAWAHRVVVLPPGPVAMALVLRLMNVSRIKDQNERRNNFRGNGPGSEIGNVPFWIYRYTLMETDGLFNLHMG